MWSLHCSSPHWRLCPKGTLDHVLHNWEGWYQRLVGEGRAAAGHPTVHVSQTPPLPRAASPAGDLEGPSGPAERVPEALW